MKDAFQKQHEEESSSDYMIGPGGKRVMTPEATQRKLARDRAISEEVSQILVPVPVWVYDSTPPCLLPFRLELSTQTVLSYDLQERPSRIL